MATDEWLQRAWDYGVPFFLLSAFIMALVVGKIRTERELQRVELEIAALRREKEKLEEAKTRLIEVVAKNDDTLRESLKTTDKVCHVLPRGDR